jgi:hypothetical protein
MNIVRLAGVATLLVLIPILVMLWRKDLRRTRQIGAAGISRAR